jgi:hypothetical protein
MPGSGKVIALTQQTGRKAWEWFVFPAWVRRARDVAEEFRLVEDRGAVWLVGAADPDLGLVYFGTGNGVPQHCRRHARRRQRISAPSWRSRSKPASCVGYQTIRHDIWEADIAESPVLFDGRSVAARKAIAAMRTDGYLFMLDRETGKPLMPIEERKVPQDRATILCQHSRILSAPSPCCPIARRAEAADPSGFEPAAFLPGSLDTPNLLTPAWGMRVVPMAFSPQTGYFYAIGNASLQWFRRAEDPKTLSSGRARCCCRATGDGGD